MEPTGIYWNPPESTGLRLEFLNSTEFHWIPVDSRESDWNRWRSVNYSKEVQIKGVEEYSNNKN
jgi:hypothetical protein